MIPSNWPRWSVLVIGIGLAIVTIVAGLLLEPIGQALAPKLEPTPTLPSIGYAKPLSVGCEKCHFDKDKLLASATSAEKAEAVFIEPGSLMTTHGRLGCVTCHRGNGTAEDIDTAHQGLLPDPSIDAVDECLLCHRSLPDYIPEDRLRTPHGKIIELTKAGTCDVFCSDCHGGVGHGFDPVSGGVICSMSVCLDCHQERNLDIQLEDCSACHVGPHDVAQALNCNTCHTSTKTWEEVHLAVHPVELVGKHAEIGCFECHKWPNFRGLEYVCSDCHTRPHSFGSDECQQCHTPEGWKPVKLSEEMHPFPTDHDGANGNCTLCHPGGDTTTYNCFTCHQEEKITQEHKDKGISEIAGKCVTCHPQAK